jgi:hypothetical protein
MLFKVHGNGTTCKILQGGEYIHILVAAWDKKSD